MITVFMGQRGVGKSSVLRRLGIELKRSHPDAVLLDLDEEISKMEGLSIKEIFEAQGESGFRKAERRCFEALLQSRRSTSLYLVLGAGFDLTLLPKNIRTVWVQRTSDKKGRIFLDRPSLEENLTPLEEYHVRFQQRQPQFRRMAWEEYLVPEGLIYPNEIERQILLTNPRDVGGCLTIIPTVVEDGERWKYFIGRRLKWDIDYFEIRDDLLSDDQIDLVLQSIPKRQLLWARRRAIASLHFNESKVALVDYDRELVGDLMGSPDRILSVHTRPLGSSLEELLRELESYEGKGFHVKLAIEINDFSELRAGHEWALKSRSKRSFLPRTRSKDSEEGRWSWYRLWVGRSQKINFFREGEGSATDQPSLFQWLDRRRHSDRQFAAILGSPVAHSFTPIHQGEFFSEFKMVTLAIKVDDSDFDEAIDMLRSIGLIAAAVTSPLKIRAKRLSQKLTPSAERLDSVNTLYLDDVNGWCGHNTDLEGMKSLLEKAYEINPLDRTSLIAVWGGGGTLALIRELLPAARLFSAQTGQERQGVDLKDWSPEWVVWASGLLRSAGTTLPPAHWKPKIVVDLNYREDSGGRELAKHWGCYYVSGEEMFYSQAKYQRLFWRPLLEGRWRSRKN